MKNTWSCDSREGADGSTLGRRGVTGEEDGELGSDIKLAGVDATLNVMQSQWRVERARVTLAEV